MSNNYAVIENGKVVNSVVAEADFAAAKGWILLPEGVGIGWDYDGEFVAPVVEPIVLDYREQRAVEYPPMADYLDGIVKGDEAQVQAYIDACLAVKAKYPKPN